MSAAREITKNLVVLALLVTGPVFGQAEKSRAEVMPPPEAEDLPVLFGQQSQPPATEKTTEEDGDKKIEAGLDEYLLPDGLSLGLRALKFTFAYRDQPDNVVDVTGEGEAQMLRVRQSPESRLRQLGVTLSPAKWFRSAGDFKSAYDLAAGKGTGGFIDTKGCREGSADKKECTKWNDPLKRFDDKDAGTKLDYLAWTGGDRLLRRVALGLSVEFATNERQRDFGTMESPQGRDDTWIFKFDPDALSVFPGDLSAAYAALLAHTSLSKDNKANLVTGGACASDDHPIECLNALTDRTVKGRWLAALIPSFEWKRASQFEFLNLNGNFVTSPDIEETLDTFTLTWDLGATLDTAKHRRDAITAIAIHNKLVEQAKMRNGTEVVLSGDPTIPFAEGELVYHAYTAELKKEGEPIDDVSFTWSGHVGTGTKGDSLGTLGLSITSDGALVGKPNSSASGKEVTIAAADEFKSVGRVTVTLVPRG